LLELLGADVPLGAGDGCRRSVDVPLRQSEPEAARTLAVLCLRALVSAFSPWP